MSLNVFDMFDRSCPGDGATDLDARLHGPAKAFIGYGALVAVEGDLGFGQIHQIQIPEREDYAKWIKVEAFGLPWLQSIGDARIAPLPAGGVSVREKVKNNADWFITSFQEVLVPCRNSRVCDGLWRFLAN